MCGIGGFRGELFASRKEKTLKCLADGLKSRGEHATGIGFFNKEKAKILKAPVAPSKVDWETLFKFSPCISDTIIFHNRFATHGKPEVNKNNHPFLGENFLLAHNGVLSNYKQLLAEYGLVVTEKEPETDSYALVKILNHLTKTMDIVDALKELCPKVDGSMVLTILCKDGRLILVRGSKYSYKLYRINEKNYLYASAANYSNSKEHIDIAIEPLILDLYKDTKGNFNIEKIDIPEWSIGIIDQDGTLKFENFERPSKVSTASYCGSSTGGKYKVETGNYYGGYNSYYNSYNSSKNSFKQQTLFDEENFDDETGELVNNSSSFQTYVNDVMEYIEDEWEKYSDKKFKPLYRDIKDVVVTEAGYDCNIFPASILAEELLNNDFRDVISIKKVRNVIEKHLEKN